MTPRAPYAADPAHSRGRRFPEPPSGRDSRRTAFQRDRDRIVHSIPFRRLRHKTQVFVAPDGDHFRVRLTHSIEVAQIGRTIARALGLDEDLTEALCLAHDLGHPPFGHSGEKALDTAMARAGGFDHNGHALRLLSEIESPYPLWPGLNLSWETLEGLAKHNGPVAAPGWALAAVDSGYGLALESWPSLEAQVAAIADDIAYDNHDIDDGLRAGLLDFEELMGVPLQAQGWREVLARFPGLDPVRLQPELVRHQIGRMVDDVIETTRSNIAAAGIEAIEDVRNAGQALVGFSPAMAAAEAAHKAFMYAKLYHHPRQIGIAEVTASVVTGLFQAYAANPDALPGDWRVRLPEGEPQRARHIGDFIAGMTDRYAIDRHRELVGPVALPDAF